MPHDPMRTLLRLRHAALDDARRGLAEALAAEDAAAGARRGAEQAIHRETCIAAASDSDLDVERFALWLSRGRSRLAEAERGVAEAAAVTAAKRAELNLARASARATASVIQRRDALERQQEARIAQRDLDDVGQRLVVEGRRRED